MPNPDTDNERISHRVEWLDACRAPACCAVILHHAGGGRFGSLGLIGVPFFTIIAVAFAVSSSNKRSFMESAWIRCHRLLLPFAAWTLVYLSASCFPSVTGITWRPKSVAEMTIVGGSYHLWFIPFIFAMTLFAESLRPALRSWAFQKSRSLIAAGFLLSLLCVFLPGPHLLLPDSLRGYFWRAWYEMPVVIIGLVAGILMVAKLPDWRKSIERPRVLGAGLFFAGIASIAMSDTFGLGRRGVQCAVIPLVFAVMIIPDGRCGRWLARLAPLTLSVYLSHILIMSLILQQGARISVNFEKGDGILGTAILSAITIIISFGVAAGFQPSTFTAFERRSST